MVDRPGPKEVATMERQRIMPDWGYGWRGGNYTTLSHGWRVGPFVWIGGQVALDEEGRVVHEGDMGAQTRYVYEAIRRLLAEAGATMADVVKINTFMALDPADPEFDMKWEQMSAVRKEYFPAEGPATLGVPVPGLRYPGLLVEVDAMAVIRGAPLE
jgi:enamine deaminase RidA (YjgF/YER057c/UK114 family)